jgi:hypothetical protein
LKNFTLNYTAAVNLIKAQDFSLCSERHTIRTFLATGSPFNLVAGSKNLGYSLLLNLKT